METIAIIVGTVTGVLAVSGGAYKCYKELQDRDVRQKQQIVIQQSNKSEEPSPVLDKTVKEAIRHHFEHNQNDETDINIKIHIESHPLAPSLVRHRSRSIEKDDTIKERK